MVRNLTNNEIFELEQTIDVLWELYDDALGQDNSELAESFASKAFQQLERLPKNQVYLQVKH